MPFFPDENGRRTGDGKSAGSAASPGRKGVSPLIAVVLAIAFTVGMAALLTFWATTFFEEATGTVEEEGQQVIECQYAGISIFDATWDDGADVVDVVLRNTGTVDLPNVTVHAFSAGRIEGSASTDLESGQLKGLSVPYTLSQEPDKVAAVTTNCPGTDDEETNIGTR